MESAAAAAVMNSNAIYNSFADNLKLYIEKYQQWWETDAFKDSLRDLQIERPTCFTKECGKTILHTQTVHNKRQRYRLFFKNNCYRYFDINDNSS